MSLPESRSLGRLVMLMARDIPPLKENDFYSLHFIPSFPDFSPCKKEQSGAKEGRRGEENKEEDSRVEEKSGKDRRRDESRKEQGIEERRGAAAMF